MLPAFLNTPQKWVWRCPQVTGDPDLVLCWVWSRVHHSLPLPFTCKNQVAAFLYGPHKKGHKTPKRPRGHFSPTQVYVAVLDTAVARWGKSSISREARKRKSGRETEAVPYWWPLLHQAGRIFRYLLEVHQDGWMTKFPFLCKVPQRERPIDRSLSQRPFWLSPKKSMEVATAHAVSPSESLHS